MAARVIDQVRDRVPHLFRIDGHRRVWRSRAHKVDVEMRREAPGTLQLALAQGDEVGGRAPGRLGPVEMRHLQQRGDQPARTHGRCRLDGLGADWMGQPRRLGDRPGHTQLDQVAVVNA